ncbi:integrase [Pseudomonas sp. SWRI100]|uniref:integrase n=1 Tax=Pseudomonas TaxID=286 RepID=UPI001644B803|nr:MULTISPECIES: integrase [Pseudomonas]MBC3495707.1 integrase [Pseudomonas sp. SWRI67]MBV4526815.1 integrase [Pseudomonas kermanshahensis]
MEFIPGESVFLKERKGFFIVLRYNAESDKYIVQSSDTLEGPWEVDRDSVLKISLDITERMRSEALAIDTERREKAEELQPSSRYTDDQISIARKRERIIKPLYEAKEITKADKVWAMEKLDIKLTVLNELLAKYRKWPHWESLVPGRPGRPKGVNQFSQEVRDVMVEASKKDAVGPGKTVQARINGARARLLELNIDDAPSASTMRRWYEQHVSAREEATKDMGSKFARDKYNSYELGVHTTHALQLIHADNSPLDCHAVDPDTGKWLGRPNLTIIVDDHTSSYLGFALSFRAPSRNTLADAMLMAIQPKDALLEEFGLKREFVWMQYGAGEVYRVDGGGDLNAKTVLAGLDKHGITPQRRTRPQSGGKVERAFGKINPLFMQRLHGAIASNRKMVRGENPQSMAKYSIQDLFVLIITGICVWHEYSGSDRLTPNQRWLESFGARDGVISIPRTLHNPKQFWIDILHERNPRVRREGILTIELLYEAGPYKNQVGQPVRIKIDHNNIHHAWVEFKGQWEEIRLINKDIKKIPKTMWEWDIKRKFGQPKNQLTIQGLLYLNAQRRLMGTLITDQHLKRLEQSRELQERSLNALSPDLIADSVDSTSTATASTPDERSAPAPRGPAPPMMGDDDL